MTMPTILQSKVLTWLLVVAVLLAFAALFIGVIDEDHWSAFVRGLFAIAVSGDNPT